MDVHTQTREQIQKEHIMAQPENKPLQGKIAVVTGATRNAGRGNAQRRAGHRDRAWDCRGDRLLHRT
jgi:hypothetical protein